MAMFKQHLRNAAPSEYPRHTGPRWIAGLYISVTVPTSSWGTFIMQV